MQCKVPENIPIDDSLGCVAYLTHRSSSGFRPVITRQRIVQEYVVRRNHETVAVLRNATGYHISVNMAHELARSRILVFPVSNQVLVTLWDRTPCKTIKFKIN